MRFTGYSFGSIRVDGVTYDHDLIIDRGKISKRKEGRLAQVPRRIRAHPALGRRGHPMAMPPASGRHRR